MSDKRPLILIVDDEPEFLEIFGTKLSAEGFGVETAINGEEGIKKAKILKPDLVLMDVKMPGMSGADAVLRLREDAETKNTKVVFLTSLGNPSAEMQQMSRRISSEFGAQGYIKKTDDLDRLVDQIRSFLH